MTGRCPRSSIDAPDLACAHRVASRASMVIASRRLRRRQMWHWLSRMRTVCCMAQATPRLGRIYCRRLYCRRPLRRPCQHRCRLQATVIACRRLGLMTSSKLTAGCPRLLSPGLLCPSRDGGGDASLPSPRLLCPSRLGTRMCNSCEGRRFYRLKRRSLRRHSHHRLHCLEHRSTRRCHRRGSTYRSTCCQPL